MIRIVLVEDQTMFREALAGLLALEPDFEVVAQLSDGEHVAEVFEKHAPVVAIFDIELPRTSGLELAAWVRDQWPSCRVIILTMFALPGYLKKALESGVSAFLSKDTPVQRLAQAIRRAVEGHRTIDPELAFSALEVGDNPLTERERDVLRAAESGQSLQDIADQLYLSYGTVRNYLSIVIQKLDARNKVDAARKARASGWL